MSIRDKEMARSMYASMFRIRRFEEEVFEFYKRGLMPGLAHLYIGFLADIPTGATGTWWPAAPMSSA